jgi:hypothetical protein
MAPIQHTKRTPQSYRRMGYKRLRVSAPSPFERHDYRTLFPYDANAMPWNEADGTPWDEGTTADLRAALANGDTVAEAAIFLQYWEATVRAKMKELGLKEQRPRRGPRRMTRKA